jgi:hypothetical protein
MNASNTHTCFNCGKEYDSERMLERHKSSFSDCVHIGSENPLQIVKASHPADTVIKGCDICYTNSRFTYSKPQWSPISHWIFRPNDKRRVFAIMCMWRHGTIFSQLPRDVVYMIIADPRVMLVSYERMDQCDTCTVAMVKTPKCSVCVDYYSARDRTQRCLSPPKEHIETRVRGICVNCKIGKIHLCTLHRKRTFYKCENCIYKWKC